MYIDVDIIMYIIKYTLTLVSILSTTQVMYTYELICYHNLKLTLANFNS